MITISESQMTAMRETQMAEFVDELSVRMRSRHPEPTSDLSDPDLTEAIAREIEAAQSHGLEKRRELERFTSLAMVLGFGFSSSEQWARKVFEDTEQTPQARLRAVEESAAFVSRGM